jgi:putative flippase GtrA
MSDLTQFAAFVGVGCVNTVIDFGLFNVAARRPFLFHWVIASLFSTTVAMSFSFAMNFLLVFRSDGEIWTRGAQFVIVTAFSAYVIQSMVILLARRASSLAGGEGILIGGRFFLATGEIVERNLAKLMAVAAGFLWNFLWYKHFVFA